MTSRRRVPWLLLGLLLLAGCLDATQYRSASDLCTQSCSPAHGGVAIFDGWSCGCRCKDDSTSTISPCPRLTGLYGPPGHVPTAVPQNALD